MKKNLPGWAIRPLDALIEVVTPRSDEFHPDLTENIREGIDKFVGYFPIHLKLGFPLGLMLLEFGAVIFMGKWKRFSKMSLEERDIYVKDWINSRLQVRRELIRGVKGLVLVAFYSDPMVMEHIGYDLQGHIRECTAKEFN